MIRSTIALVTLAFALALAAGGAQAQPLEVRARRGVGGVVAAGGIDVVELEVVNAAAVPFEVTVTVEGRARPLSLAARGAATLALARRIPPGADALPATSVTVSVPGGARVATDIPAARVVHRPVVVITDDAAAIVPRVDRWRRDLALGPPVMVIPDAMPRRWQTLSGVGAVVIDRPASALAAPARQQIARVLAMGAPVCRWSDGDATAPVCVRAAPITPPRTRVVATVRPAIDQLAAAAGAVAALLALAAMARRMRWRVAAVVAALAIGGVMPFVRTSDHGLRVHGTRVAAGGGEDWVLAEIGASELGGVELLGGDLWIEPSAPVAPGTLAPLDDAGLAGRIPAAGSWRARGFVPAATGGWTDALSRTTRPVVEAP